MQRKNLVLQVALFNELESFNEEVQLYIHNDKTTKEEGGQLCS